MDLLDLVESLALVDTNPYLKPNLAQGMDSLFAILLLLSLVGLLITLIKPSWGLFWLNTPSRKKGLLIYNLACFLFFFCFGVSNSFPFKVPPYNVNSDSIKHAFSHSVPAYTFGSYDTISAKEISAYGFLSRDSQKRGDYICISYNPQNRVVYNAYLAVSQPDTTITSSDIDKLIAFAGYFDKGAADQYRNLKSTLLNNLFWLEIPSNGNDKNIGFALESYPYTRAKGQISRGENVDCDLHISISVENLRENECPNPPSIKQIETKLPKTAKFLGTLTTWIVKVWSFIDFYPYGPQAIDFDFSYPGCPQVGGYFVNTRMN